ncbi:MAG: hypothetical protein ACRD8O_22380 [Bryobacteraceae bacterium]
MAKVGVILVHGIGDQKRYDFLKEFTTAFYQALRQRSDSANPRLIIDRVELSRMGVRTLETSDLFAFFGTNHGLDADGRKNLFRPATVVRDEDEFLLYEAFWADEDLRHTQWEKIKFNFWLLTTLWNPLFNLLTGKYRRFGFQPYRVIWNWLGIIFADFLVHVSEGALLLVAFVFRKTEPLRHVGDVIYEYAGDVKLYFSQRSYFHNQTKHEVLRSRFDEVLLKASIETDAVHIVGHSLGTVLAFDCLHLHQIEPQKMSLDFLHYLSEDVLPKEPDQTLRVSPFGKLRTFVSLGSPLDKTCLIFPSSRPTELQRPVRLRLETLPDGRRIVCAKLEPKAEDLHSNFKWHNIDDISDPIGDDLVWYGKSQPDKPTDFPAPENHSQAKAWLPSTAHNGLLKNRLVIEWITSRIARPDGEARQIPQPDFSDRIVHSAWLGALFALSTVAGCFGFYWLLDMALGMAHDLYADAESHTIFSKLSLLDLWIATLRDQMDLNTGPGLRYLLWPVLLTARIFLTLAVITLPFAALQYRKTESLRIARQTQERSQLG